MPRRQLALFAVVLQLVLALPVFPGLVLCVGSDGHVAVESGGCGDETPAVSGDCDAFGASTPCTDTPLAASELLSGTGSRTAYDGVLAAAPGLTGIRFLDAPARSGGEALKPPKRKPWSPVRRHESQARSPNASAR